MSCSSDTHRHFCGFPTVFSPIAPFHPAFYQRLLLALTFCSQSGLPDDDAFDLTIGQYALAGVATLLSMGILERVGRRTLWLAGLAGMLVPIVCIGVLSLLPNQTAAVVWPQGVLVLVRFFAYGVSCGPIPFVYCGEVGSVRLRQKVCMERGRGSESLFVAVPSMTDMSLLMLCRRSLSRETHSTLPTSSRLAFRLT